MEAFKRLKREPLRREFVPGRVREVNVKEKNGPEQELLGEVAHI